MIVSFNTLELPANSPNNWSNFIAISSLVSMFDIHASNYIDFNRNTLNIVLKTLINPSFH